MFQVSLASAMGLIALYVIIRLIVPAKGPLALKILLGLLALAATQKLLLLRWFTGSSLSALAGKGSAWLLLWTGFAQAVVLCLFGLCLLRDVFLLILWGLRRLQGREKAPTARFGPGLLALLAVLLAGYGVWEAVRVPDVREVSIPVPHLPPALDGLRLVQLSDLHLGPINDRKWVSSVVERVNALKPDLVLITGDSVDGSPHALAQDIAPLAEVKAPYGVFWVAGNHEYYSGFQPWVTAFRKLGLHVLVNSSEYIEIKGTKGNAPLVVAGLSDPAASRFGPPLEPPRPRQVLDGIRQKNIRQSGGEGEQAKTGEGIGEELGEGAGGGRVQPTVLLLAHHPSLAPEAAAAGASLQLSGHTHGGQVLFISPLVAKLNEGFVQGLYAVQGMPLYVSAGTSQWAGMPLRLFVPAEISLITLKAPTS